MTDLLALVAVLAAAAVVFLAWFAHEVRTAPLLPGDLSRLDRLDGLCDCAGCVVDEWRRS